MQRRTLLSALAAAGASTAAPWASAQADYPNQLIRWVVPYPAGGGTDVLARTVAEAMPILSDSIRKMTLQDAKAILTGGDDSVTQYFQRSSSDQLTKKFLPIVKAATTKLQLAEQYNTFAGKAASMGLIDEKDADIDSYVTQKAMDGLFLMIAEEEKKLRSNPMQAGSALLKKVFGAL